MEAEQVNREIAEKVMGWHMVYEEHLGEAWWVGDNLVMSVSDFDPMHRIEHSMMALAKFPEWSILKQEHNGKAVYKARAGIVYGPICDTPSEAVSRAALKAKEE